MPKFDDIVSLIIGLMGELRHPLKRCFAGFIDVVFLLMPSVFLFLGILTARWFLSVTGNKPPDAVHEFVLSLASGSFLLSVSWEHSHRFGRLVFRACMEKRMEEQRGIASEGFRKFVTILFLLFCMGAAFLLGVLAIVDYEANTNNYHEMGWLNNAVMLLFVSVYTLGSADYLLERNR